MMANSQSKNSATERSFAAGEFIFEEGQVGDYAYVQVSGELEITKLSKGEFIKLMDVETGRMFGEMALIDKSVRSASARAVTDVVVREIDEQALMAYIKRSPEVAMNMMYRLANYVRTSAKNLEGTEFGKTSHHSGSESSATNDDKNGLLSWSSDSDHIINEFQSSQIEIEKSKLPPIIQYTFASIVLLIAAFFAWASISVIDTTISSRGRLSTTVPTIQVQATDNSVVKELRVAIGQHVKKGDDLVILDETYTEADLSRAEIEFKLLRSKIQRLTAEMNKEDLSSADKIDNLIERSVFVSRFREYSSRITSLDLKIKNNSQKLKTLNGDIELAKEQLEIQLQMEEARRILYEREIGSHINLLTARNSRLGTEREYRGLQNTVNNYKSDIESIRAEKQAFISGWLSSIGQELSVAIKDRDAKTEDLVKLRRRQKNVQIKSPSDGVIMEIENLFVGALVNEGSAIMSLVPSNVPLTVEMDIDPRDIGNLILGASVSIKLDALPFQKHGELVGEISFISEDTVDESLDGQPGAYYRVRADILSEDLRDTPDNFRLVSGMLLNGDIRAGRRRLITYFIYPIIRTIKTSFSEPGQ